MQARFWLAVTVGALLQLGLAAHSAAVEGVHSADQLLSRLSHTLQEKNYRGLFTYEYGGTLDTLEIVHLVQDGREYERIQHLNGPERAVVREGRSIGCVSTAAQLLRGGLLAPRHNSAQLHQYYDFSLGGTERVAGRPATVVRLVPKDSYRYGLTLSVDKASGFPVKTLVVTENRRVLERIQFVELDMGIDPGAIDTSGQGDLAVQASCDEEQKASAGTAAAQELPAGVLQWQAQWLPQGFVLSERSYSDADGHHLTYTDGLASFSVFVTHADSRSPVKPGLAQRGATVALMIVLPLQEQPVNVAVVGEIPPATAEQVALAMRPLNSEESQR